MYSKTHFLLTSLCQMIVTRYRGGDGCILLDIAYTDIVGM